ncbi:Subtilisin-like protease SBT2.1 [Linum grandiflorum]
MALLSAVKAGIFVVQAAGNTGPSPKSMSSFSPWIFTVGAASHDRIYSNSVTLGNNVTIQGVGLARKSFIRSKNVASFRILTNLKTFLFHISGNRGR